jgi:fluoride ion exporter CrcB/FEX
LRTIERASLNGDSAVGAFATANVTLVASRSLHTTTTLRDSLYVIGRLGTETNVQRARINSEGQLDSFTTVSGLSLVTLRDGHTTVVIRNSLYVIGGEGEGYQSSIERANVNDDGSLDAFALVPGVALNVGRFGHVSVVLGNYLYVIGGFGGATAPGRLTSVERATIDSSGGIGLFSIVPGVSLNTGRNLFTCVVTGAFLYVLGGGSDAVELQTVERASIAPDGSLGPFTTVSDLALRVSRISHANAIVGNALYVVGGRSNFLSTAVIERSVIGLDGSLATFSSATNTALATPRASHTISVIGDAMYIIGGGVPLRESVEHASLR